MKIGYISPADPFVDKKGWSGTYYGICKALETSGHHVEWIPYKNSRFINKVLSKVYRIFFGKGSYYHSRLISNYHKVSINNHDLNKYDLIFVPAQVDIVAGLITNVPIVYYTDGTVPVMLNYYWFGFNEKAIKEAKIVEKKALDNATLNIFASHWAANSAINDYKVSSKKVDVLPFGANIDDSLINYKEKDYNSHENELNLLFSGVNWERKGGNIAVDAIRELNNRGIKATLYICGIKQNDLPEDIVGLNYIKNVGFLNKNNESELREYLKIWEQTDIFILPTKAECFGIVFNEANAYGIPILTTDTGGISDCVINGENGQRLPLDARGSEYADIIQKWIENHELDRLSKNARKIYLSKNNWNAWGEKFNALANQIIDKENV